MTARRKREWTEFAQFRTWPFIGIHLVAVGGVIYSGWSWSGFALAIGLYYARMFFVTAGYHRYFSHRSFKTSRVFQFILALGGCCTIQKGPLWWAANHRHHHRASDQEDDIHSPVVHGFWWSHLGWVLVEDYQHTAWDDIRDMAKFRELRWLNRYDLVPVIAMALLLQVFWGWHALLWGFFVSSTLLWHGTFTINSLSHVFGSRRYDTGDASRNNWFLAIVTMGEGWHNNHHHYMNSANQGFFWWEIDMSYILLRILAVFGVVWDLRKPPKHILARVSKKANRPTFPKDSTTG